MRSLSCSRMSTERRATLPATMTAERSGTPASPTNFCRDGTTSPESASFERRAAGVQIQFGEELGKLHAMVESLSRQGHIEHLLPDLPGALVPTYSQLIEADVPEVLCRRLVKFVADHLEPEDLRALSLEASLIAGIPLAGTNRVFGGGPGWKESHGGHA